MARISFDLDKETFDQLVRTADAEHRPVRWQAKVALCRGLAVVEPREEPDGIDVERVTRDQAAVVVAAA